MVPTSRLLPMGRWTSWHPQNLVKIDALDFMEFPDFFGGLENVAKLEFMNKPQIYQNWNSWNFRIFLANWTNFLS